MHASMAYLNGGVNSDDTMEMLNTLLAGARTQGDKTQDHDKTQDQAEKARQSDGASRPGGFRNDPDDPSNPNEVRERHLKKVDRKLNR